MKVPEKQPITKIIIINVNPPQIAAIRLNTPTKIISIPQKVSTCVRLGFAVASKIKNGRLRCRSKYKPRYSAIIAKAKIKIVISIISSNKKAIAKPSLQLPQIIKLRKF